MILRFFSCLLWLSSIGLNLAHGLDIDVSVSNGDTLTIDAQKDFTIDRQKKAVSANGNVKAVKGDVTLYCDKLTLHYKENKKTKTEQVDRVVATGNVRVQRQDQELRAKTMTAFLVQTKAGATELGSITAEGDLIITTEQEVITAKRLLYKAEPDTVYLYNDVRITKGENILSGQYAEVSRKTGVSKVLPAIPGKGKKNPGRIQALIIPKSTPEIQIPGKK